MKIADAKDCICGCNNTCVRDDPPNNMTSNAAIAAIVFILILWGTVAWVTWSLTGPPDESKYHPPREGPVWDVLPHSH